MKPYFATSQPKTKTFSLLIGKSKSIFTKTKTKETAKSKNFLKKKNFEYKSPHLPDEEFYSHEQ
ncbi:hypothetical protein OA511_03285 [Prochlorococcus sp. AH-716-J09]|nr:hypothetical protein [Prochlorococcus sp. AH-716-J09]